MSLYITGLHPHSSGAQDTSKCKQQWNNQFKFWINVHVMCNLRTTIIILFSFLMYVFMNSRHMPILSINYCVWENIGTRLLCRLTKQETRPNFCNALIVVELQNKPTGEDLQPIIVRLCYQELSAGRKWLPVLWKWNPTLQLPVCFGPCKYHFYRPAGPWHVRRFTCHHTPGCVIEAKPHLNKQALASAALTQGRSFKNKVILNDYSVLIGHLFEHSWKSYSEDFSLFVS